MFVFEYRSNQSRRGHVIVGIFGKFVITDDTVFFVNFAIFNRHRVTASVVGEDVEQISAFARNGKFGDRTLFAGFGRERSRTRSLIIQRVDNVFNVGVRTGYKSRDFFKRKSKRIVTRYGSLVYLRLSSRDFIRVGNVSEIAALDVQSYGNVEIFEVVLIRLFHRNGKRIFLNDGIVGSHGVGFVISNRVFRVIVSIAAFVRVFTAVFIQRGRVVFNGYFVDVCRRDDGRLIVGTRLYLEVIEGYRNAREFVDGCVLQNVFFRRDRSFVVGESRNESERSKYGNNADQSGDYA